MKNITKYLLSFLLLISIISCNKIINPELDPNDPGYLAFDLLVDINLRPEADYYLVIENELTQPIYFHLSNYFGYAITRGTWLVGNEFNLHFIKINEFVNGTYEIKSFFNVPIGIRIDIRDENFKSTAKSNANLNLSFTHIPDFDIVTRSAKNQEQSFTQNTFSTPATTPELGGETFEESQLFYACFQKGTEASYKIEMIPSGISEYTIDFANLNTDMTKYTFQKVTDGASIEHADVKAYNNISIQSLPVEIFNLDNFNLFAESTFDVFVPKNLSSIRFFIQNYTFNKSETKYNIWSFSHELSTSQGLINTGLKTTSRSGQLPLIETNSANYDEVQIVVESENFKWTMHGASTNSFYIPSLPKELYDSLPGGINLLELFASYEKGTVKLIDYSDFEGYNEALPLFLSDTTKLELGSFYRTEEQEFSIK